MNRLFILVVFSFSLGQLFGQQKYGELSLSELEETTSIVRSENRSVLIAISEVPHLQFESTRQIFDIRRIAENEWHVLVEPGRQIITIRSSGFLPVTTDVINLKVKRAFRIRVAQVKAVPGTLYIKTSPSNAELRINGEPINTKTPYRADDVLPGSYYINISKEGYWPEEKTLIVKSNEITRWEVELVRSAIPVSIDIENDLKEVAVLIDGVAKGMAPCTIFLEPGIYRLILQKSGYNFLEKVINVTFDNKKIQLIEELTKLRKPFYTKWWFWTGSVAVASASALVLIPRDKPLKPLPEPPDFQN